MQPHIGFLGILVVAGITISIIDSTSPARKQVDFDPTSGYLYVDDEIPVNVIEDEFQPQAVDKNNFQIHKRWKRYTSADDDIFSWKNLPGVGTMRKLKRLYHDSKNLPPAVKEAVKKGDFANVTADDINALNVSFLEYVPPSMMNKMSAPALEQVISIFLRWNRPNALSKLVEDMGTKFSPATLIHKVHQQETLQQQSMTQQSPNEAAGILLHSAMSRLGDMGGITKKRIDVLNQYGLLKYIPEEQLMKVNDSDAAKKLLQELYTPGTSGSSEANEPDDKALIYKLLETAHGEPKEWTQRTFQSVTSDYLKFIPATTLKQISPDIVHSAIYNLRASKSFDSPFQAKTITDSFLEKEGFRRDEDGVLQGNPLSLKGIFENLGNFGAFINPAIVSLPEQLNQIITQNDKWNLPAPLLAVTKYLKSKFGGKGVSSLERSDLIGLSPEVLKNSPPEVIGRAMETQALDINSLTQIGKVENGSKGRDGFFGSPLFKGVIAQLTSYTIQQFRDYGNKYRVDRIPSPFLGGLGVRGIQDMDNQQIGQLLNKVRENPSTLDDEQKALLLKRLQDESQMETLPAELAFLRPRVKGNDIKKEDVIGLPADAELRLAHGNGKTITPTLLEKDPTLVGTLTPRQIELLDIQYIPGILSAVRKSKDGPQQQTLQVLNKRFVEYIRLKADDLDIDDKKLLKYITPAEVSKLPASVLSYLVDQKQTPKLPASVRKELLISLGEMSTKDRAMIPAKTRQEIILQGLDALDSILDDDQKYDLPELATIGHAVADLPPKAIERLSPIATEQALDIIQGTTEEDGGLNQRACLTIEQKKAWRNKIVELYGKPNTWDPSTVASLCCALPLLDEDSDLMTIDKQAIVQCHCVSDLPAPPHFAELKKALERDCEKQLGRPDETKKTFERIRTERAMDLNDLESQIITSRRRRAHDHSKHKRGLNCFGVRLAGSPSEFDHDVLASMKASDMKNCLYELGSVKLGREEERLLWEKLKEANGGEVRNIPTDQLRNAGNILSAIKPEEVNELDFTNDDVVAAFGRPFGFSKTLLVKMAERVEKVRKRTEDYKPADLIIVRNILCGFDRQDLLRIVPETFNSALPIIRNLDPNCELTHLGALAHIATHEKVYGHPANWTSADEPCWHLCFYGFAETSCQLLVKSGFFVVDNNMKSHRDLASQSNTNELVRGVGILFKGLTDVKKIPPEAFLGLSPTVAASLSENILSELTKDQLGYVPKFSAQAMTQSQIDFLSNDGRDALEETLRGPLVTGSASQISILMEAYGVLCCSLISQMLLRICA